MQVSIGTILPGLVLYFYYQPGAIVGFLLGAIFTSAIFVALFGRLFVTGNASFWVNILTQYMTKQNDKPLPSPITVTPEVFGVLKDYFVRSRENRNPPRPDQEVVKVPEVPLNTSTIDQNPVTTP